MSQWPSISSAQLCLRTSSCSWVTFYEEVGGRICTPATVKPFIPQNTKTQKISENPLRGSTSCAASLHRAAHRMTGLGQSLRDPQSLMIGGKPRGNIPGSDCGRVCRSGAEVSSTRRRSPWINLRRSCRVSAWNVLSIKDDDHLSLLSSELKRLDIGITVLSEVQRPDCGKIMVGGYTYYWSGHSDGYHTQGVAVACPIS